MNETSKPSTGRFRSPPAVRSSRSAPPPLPFHRSFPPRCSSIAPRPFSFPHHHCRPKAPHSSGGLVDFSPAPCFAVQLRRCHLSENSGESNARELINDCRPPPVDFTLCENGDAGADLYFGQWTDARDAVLCLWKSRLSLVHSFFPEIISSLLLPSDKEELVNGLKTLFIAQIEDLMYGEQVKKWERKLAQVIDEIAQLEKSKRQRRGLLPALFNKVNDKIKGLSTERHLIEKKLLEFRCAMSCIRDHVEGKAAWEELQVFKFENVDVDWNQVYHLILRECKRLEDGLPIYAYRQDILHRVYNEQLMVLIGETGSGKSTQLAQFLADSGVAVNGSIVCTQPRKIAAVSLAERVRVESTCCYRGNAIMCYPTFSSCQLFKSKVIYTTDHCLLQHYLCDKNLSGISCIIIDEAHERSLSTDLLLAMIKDLLCRRHNLRLVIMSATADANQLSEYFFGCAISHVVGRNFPVDIRYVPSAEGRSCSGSVALYVSDVLMMAREVHEKEGDGTILAFLTSQMEVEWACENFESESAVTLPLHGKLLQEEQRRVFQNFSGKRKVIFCTNLAETSLTIPGVKYVIDCGMVKESKFEAGTGMNVLQVSRISQSSANQRAGRAGRTEPGCCYRLYSESDFDSMPLSQEPEIRRVHLGIAVLRILALGPSSLRDFDFVDAPSDKAIDMAIRNLLQLGAIRMTNDTFELTDEGRYLIKLGAEPRLGKLIYSCFHYGLGREGVVLAAVMANASNIFCRVGSDKDKLKSDCLKVQFCHCSGDLFTLLSVYKEWENVPRERRNKWCWENSINAKSMRRCQETVKDYEDCLKRELCVKVPPSWHWDPYKPSKYDNLLKNVILSCLSENVAMFSGYDKLGYEVAMTGQHVQLHPSCSLLSFGQKPTWVVFSEILSLSHPYLVCVTAFEYESLSSLCPPPLFDFLKMESRKLQVRVMTGFGSTLLRKFCGRSNSSLQSLVAHIQKECRDERVTVQVSVDLNEVSLFASSQDMGKAYAFVSNSLNWERKWLFNECIEKNLYHRPGISSPVVLFGAGAEIKHLELDKHFLTVDVCHESIDAIDDKELLVFLEKHAQGSICGVHKFTASGHNENDKEKWGKVTFVNPEAAKRAVELPEIEFSGAMLKLQPSRSCFGSDSKIHSFPAVKAIVKWPRKISKGIGIVICDPRDLHAMVDQFSNLIIGGRTIRAEISKRYRDSIVIIGLARELSDDEILDLLRMVTNRRILRFFVIRGDAVENPPTNSCGEALLREITPFMPKSNPRASHCSVQVFAPEPNDSFMKAFITFDGRLHLEAAKALEQIEGKVLPGCSPWQKMKCEQLFHSSVSCPPHVYYVIKDKLDALVRRLKHVEGADCSLEKTFNGCIRVKISANATKTVAELRRPVEELVSGKTIDLHSVGLSLLQPLYSRDGINILESLQRETGTRILFDRRSQKLRVFGSSDKIARAEEKLVKSLVSLQETRQLEIQLRGRDLPPDLMKEVVKVFGPDLHGLKEKLPDAEFSLNVRRHIISVKGSKDMKEKAEKIIYDLAKTIDALSDRLDGALQAADPCPICLCEVEDGYKLEGCSHIFCRACLIEQCESAIRNQDSFPLCCSHEDCKSPFLITDLKSLLSVESMEELFQASVGAYVVSSGGLYRFCPSPDCPSVYRVTGPGKAPELFVCGACYAETCTRCHLEYHPFVSCERYREFKEDPDLSLKEWCFGKENVKGCPMCGYTIEKSEGCNHIECRCGRHICWACLEVFRTSDDCYSHLRSVHSAID